MRCPVDRSELLQQQLGTANIAICRDCGGLWLTRAARQAPSPDPTTLPEATRKPREGSAPKRKFRLCPGCPNALTRERVEGIEIDRCKFCDGIWLDAGEYDAVRRRIEVPAIPVPRLTDPVSLRGLGLGEVLEQPDVVEGILDLSLGAIEFLLRSIL